MNKLRCSQMRLCLRLWGQKASPSQITRVVFWKTEKVKGKGISEALEMNLWATEIHFPRAV